MVTKESLTPTFFILVPRAFSVPRSPSEGKGPGNEDALFSATLKGSFTKFEENPWSGNCAIAQVLSLEFLTAPIKLGPKQKNEDTTGKGWLADQFSESQTEVLRSTIILKIVIFIRFCMADELNGQALPLHHTSPYKNYNFQNDGTARYFGL